MSEISDAAAIMGRKGGRARAKALTPERRLEISRLANEAYRAKLRAQVAKSRLDPGSRRSVVMSG
jgi:hypothetical protein